MLGSTGTNGFLTLFAGFQSPLMNYRRNRHLPEEHGKNKTECKIKLLHLSHMRRPAGAAPLPRRHPRYAWREWWVLPSSSDARRLFDDITLRTKSGHLTDTRVLFTQIPEWIRTSSPGPSWSSGSTVPTDFGRLRRRS